MGKRYASVSDMVRDTCEPDFAADYERQRADKAEDRAKCLSALLQEFIDASDRSYERMKLQGMDIRALNGPGAQFVERARAALCNNLEDK